MAQGADPLHLLNDVLVIALGGIEGNQFLGIGFADQTLIWNRSALQNLQVLFWRIRVRRCQCELWLSSGLKGSPATTDAIESVLELPTADHFPDENPCGNNLLEGV